MRKEVEIQPQNTNFAYEMLSMQTEMTKTKERGRWYDFEFVAATTKNGDFLQSIQTYIRIM